MAGDYIGPFTAGHVALIGPGLPHDWMGDIAPGEQLVGRDVVLQFDGAALLDLQGSLPELSELKTLFELAQRGIEFTGGTAVEAALLLERIGEATGLQRLIMFLQLIGTLARAPKREIRVLASACYSPSLNERSSERINQAFDYLINELTSDVRLSVIAERVGMSEAGFFHAFFQTNHWPRIHGPDAQAAHPACMSTTRPDTALGRRNLLRGRLRKTSPISIATSVMKCIRPRATTGVLLP